MTVPANQAEWHSLHNIIASGDPLPPDAPVLFTKLCHSILTLSKNVCQSQETVKTKEQPAVGEKRPLENHGDAAQPDDKVSIVSSDKSERDQMLLLLTILYNFLKHALNNLSYAAVCHAIIPPYLADGLLVVLKCKDAFVRHITCKCASLLFIQPTVQIGPESLEKLVVQSLDPSALSNLQPVLSLFEEIFSGKQTNNQQDTEDSIKALHNVCHTVLTKHWPALSEIILTDEKRWTHCDSTTVSFLMLWEKLTKHQQDHSSENQNDIIYESAIYLLPKLQDKQLTSVIYCKVVDILNSCLPYGRLASSRVSISDFHVHLSDQVVERIQDGLLHSAPVIQDGHSFGGSSQEQDTPQHDGNGCCPSKKRRENSEMDTVEAGEEKDTKIDTRAQRKIILLTVKASAVLLKASPDKGNPELVSRILNTLNTLHIWCTSKAMAPAAVSSSQHWIVAALMDQDDHLVEAMLCLLDIYTTSRLSKVGTNICLLSSFEPHHIFLSFLESTTHDHTMLLDLLTSPETCFLLYFIKYLHYVVNVWSELCHICRRYTGRKKQGVPVSGSAPVAEKPTTMEDDILIEMAEKVVGYDVDGEVKEEVRDMLREVNSLRMRTTDKDLVVAVQHDMERLQLMKLEMQTFMKKAHNVFHAEGAGDKTSTAITESVALPVVTSGGSGENQTKETLTENRSETVSTPSESKSVVETLVVGPEKKEITTTKSTTSGTSESPNEKDMEVTSSQLIDYPDTDSEHGSTTTPEKSIPKKPDFPDYAKFLEKYEDRDLLRSIIKDIVREDDTVSKQTLRKLTSYSDSSSGDENDTESHHTRKTNPSTKKKKVPTATLR